MTTKLTPHLVAENTLAASDDQRIRDLLCLSFARHIDIFSQASYYYSLPEYRLWLENDTGDMVAHLDFERRVIGVGDVDVSIVGVGEVATHPDWQGQGIGRQLMQAFRAVLVDDLQVDFGYLQCREVVVSFYERVGWHRIHQQIREIDIKTGEPIIGNGPAMIFPVACTLDEWPQSGLVDLRGLAW